MSRIILSRHDNGQERFVVGWDHPAQGCFWQEFNREPDPDPVTGRVDWDNNEEWVEVSRYGGMWPGIPLDNFRENVPEDLRPLVTDEVMKLLWEHSQDAESGRKQPVNLAPTAR